MYHKVTSFECLGKDHSIYPTAPDLAEEPSAGQLEVTTAP